jgi:hypothetical protein
MVVLHWSLLLVDGWMQQSFSFVDVGCMLTVPGAAPGYSQYSVHPAKSAEFFGFNRETFTTQKLLGQFAF